VRSILLIIVLFFLTSCGSAKVRARTLYTNRSNLASRILDTPDPLKGNTGLGQCIWVRWNVPKQYNDLQLDVTIRFENKTERHELFPVQGLFGTLSIEISPSEYLEKGPLLSYQILLKSGDCVVASTRHKLWVEKIEILDV
jgi:hypothetical protein